MADKPDREFRILLILTLIPVTDFVGANWFYMRNDPIYGVIKIFLSVISLSIVLFLVMVEPTLANVVFFFFGFFVLAASVLWWLVDIFLVVLRKRL